MKKRRKLDIKMTMGLTLIPMLDMLTVVLIFLIVNFSPEKSQVKTQDGLKLPKAEMLLREVPRIHIQVTKASVSVNGATLAGLVPEQENQDWSPLRNKLLELSPRPQPVLLIAHKDADYIYVDRTAAHMAAAGFSDIYLLTEREERLQ